MQACRGSEVAGLGFKSNLPICIYLSNKRLKQGRAFKFLTISWFTVLSVRILLLGLSTMVPCTLKLPNGHLRPLHHQSTDARRFDIANTIKCCLCRLGESSDKDLIIYSFAVPQDPSV